MNNKIYTNVIERIKSHLGANDDLHSGNGTRFKNSQKVVLTVYHANLAPGNSVEIAIKSDSLKSSNNEVRESIMELGSITGHPVNLDSRYRWPRVGIKTLSEAEEVIEQLARIWA